MNIGEIIIALSGIAGAVVAIIVSISKVLESQSEAKSAKIQELRGVNEQLRKDKAELLEVLKNLKKIN
jgi:hypothetical protein